MKKFLISATIIFFALNLVFAQNTDNLDDKIKSPEEILRVFEEEDTIVADLDEFDVPVERAKVKNVIKVDIVTPVTAGLLAFYNVIPSDKTRVPLFYEYAFSNYCSVQVEAEAITKLIVPSAAGISAGFAIYPLGKAPYGLFLSVRGGGMFGMFLGGNVQASLGWQFITKSNFVISLGGEFAYYFVANGEQFFIPSIGISLGYGF